MIMTLRLSLLAALFLFTPLTVQARPVSVILYPAGALVTEEENLRPENGRVTLHVPAGADEGSLEFSLSRGSVTGSTSVVKAGQPALKTAQLLEELRTLEKESALTAARRESLTHERHFWSRQPALSPDDGAQDRQAHIVAGHLETLAVKDAELSASLLDLAERKKAVEDTLNALGPQNKNVRECVLEVSDTGREPVLVRWSYYLNDAGWEPRYRVQALQDAGKVLITMEAVVRQGSGMDWDGVETVLSSSEDFRSVTPPPLPDWVLGGERLPAAPRSMNLLAARAPAMDEAAVVAKASPMSHASGLRWSLGTVDIPAGALTTRPVDDHSFDAAFFRLIRPTEDDRAWITATLEEDSLPLLPAGQATFLVDGVENARSVLRIAPGDRTVSFGIDQLIGVKKHDLPTQGEQSPAGTKTTQWRWRTDITNGHDKAVDVRVEAAAPILRDTRMTEKVKSKPAADFDEEHSRHEWRLEVPALRTISIVHEVTVTAPIDTTTTH